MKMQIFVQGRKRNARSALGRMWIQAGRPKNGLVRIRPYREVITSALLYGIGACESQLVKFRKVFPQGTTLSRHAFIEAAEGSLDLTWFFDTMSWGERGSMDSPHRPRGFNTVLMMDSRQEAIALWEMIRP